MSDETLTRTELLAPAGNVACLHAAIQAGANAVYLGAEAFNARRGADNFSLDDIKDACDFAHLRGAKIYLTVNTAILPGEVGEVCELIRQAYLRGVDAFIVQDIGIARFVSESFSDAALHISTQMNTHNTHGIDAAARLGARRITFARELSLEEIAYLSAYAHERGITTESFAHGAICICYSGQCYMSSMVGGRSANRGMCAQACRLPYELHNKAQHKTLNAPGEHLLSPKDLCTIEILPELVASGVDSLKIEGRMKSPEYVYAVVSSYRQALNRALVWYESDEDIPGPEVRATQTEIDAVSGAFSRGFTTAYLTGEMGNDMMSYARPNNRGVQVGRVARVQAPARTGAASAITIQTITPLTVGDVIEFWTNKGHWAHTITKNDTLSEHEARIFDTKRTQKGDRVFRVRNAQAAFDDSPYLPECILDAKVTLRVGDAASMVVRDKTGVSAQVTGPIVEAARTKELALVDVRNHINRLGNTPYRFDALDITLDEGVGMGFSTLHALRKDALLAYEEQKLQAYHKRTLSRRVHVNEHPKPQAFTRKNACSVVALATNPACARAARKAGADELYIPALNYKRGEATIAGQLSDTAEQAGYPNRARIMLPTIDHNDIESTREHKFTFDPFDYVRPNKPVIADNLGQVLRALELGAEVEVGPRVPVLNARTARELKSWGVKRIWLSSELTLGQIQQIADEVDIPLGLTVLGQSELMVTEHCMLMSQGPCNKNCTVCPRRKSPHYLKDRKGYEMPVITDLCGRSHLYNAVSMDAAHLAPDLIGAGIDAFMVDTTLMNTDEVKRSVERVVRARDLALRTGDTVSKTPGTTTGHLFRSIG